MDTFGLAGAGVHMLPHRVVGRRSADNLLAKARKVWHDDRARGVAYVQRAFRLPFDEVEQVPPVVLAAHNMLFCAVVDVLEDSDDADHRWLDAALAVLETATPLGQGVLRGVFKDVEHDRDLYGVAHADRRRLRAAVASGPVGPAPWDADCQADVDYVVTIIDLCQAYEQALNRLGEAPSPSLMT